MNTKRPSGKCHTCDKKPIKMGYCDPCFNSRQASGYFDETVQKGIERAERVGKKGRTTK